MFRKFVNGLNRLFSNLLFLFIFFFIVGGIVSYYLYPVIYGEDIDYDLSTIVLLFNSGLTLLFVVLIFLKLHKDKRK